MIVCLSWATASLNAAAGAGAELPPGPSVVVTFVSRTQVTDSAAASSLDVARRALDAAGPNNPLWCVKNLAEFVKYREAKGEALKVGAFYIVHKGRVYDKPFDTREEAWDVLQVLWADKRLTDWSAVSVFEVGNEVPYGGRV